VSASRIFAVESNFAENQSISRFERQLKKWPPAHELLLRIVNYRSVELFKRCEPMPIALTARNDSIVRHSRLAFCATQCNLSPLIKALSVGLNIQTRVLRSNRDIPTVTA
jgi:hypothetical protein